MTPAPRSGRAPPHLRFGAHLHWRCAPAQCQRVCRAHTVPVSLREPDGRLAPPGRGFAARTGGGRPASGAGVGGLGGFGAWGWIAGLLGLGLQLGLLGLLVVGVVWAVRSVGRSRRATPVGAEVPLPDVSAPPVQRVCPNCGQPTRFEWHHCPHCGAPLA